MHSIDYLNKRYRISLIAALGRNREIGKGNELLWRIPEDLKRFKELTNGHPVIMGRKTWESLPERARPLPNRTNIVVTRQREYVAPGALMDSSLDAALLHAESAPGAEEIFIIGGGELYRVALPRADRLYLTLVDGEKEADTFFPPYETLFTKQIAKEAGESNGIRYHWVVLEKN